MSNMEFNCVKAFWPVRFEAHTFPKGIPSGLASQKVRLNLLFKYYNYSFCLNAESINPDLEILSFASKT